MQQPVPISLLAWNASWMSAWTAVTSTIQHKDMVFWATTSCYWLERRKWGQPYKHERLALTAHWCRHTHNQQWQIHFHSMQAKWNITFLSGFTWSSALVNFTCKITLPTNREDMLVADPSNKSKIVFCLDSHVGHSALTELVMLDNW